MLLLAKTNTNFVVKKELHKFVDMFGCFTESMLFRNCWALVPPSLSSACHTSEPRILNVSDSAPIMKVYCAKRISDLIDDSVVSNLTTNDAVIYFLAHT